MRRVRTLRTKFLLVLLPPVVLATMVVSALFAFVSYQYLVDELDTKKQNLADYNSAALAGPLWNFDREILHRILTALMLDPDVIGERVMNDNGDVLDSIGEPATDRQSHAAVVRHAIVHSGKTRSYHLGSLEITFRRDRVRQQIKRQIIRDSLLLLFLVAAIVFSAVIVNRVIVGRPLDKLLQAIQESQLRGKRVPVTWRSTDEIGAVIDAFNDMVYRLGQEEEALRQSETRLRHTLETSPIGVEFVTVDSRFLWGNSRHAELFGIPRGEWRPHDAGIRTLSFDVADDRQETLERSGLWGPQELMFRKRDGTPWWALVSSLNTRFEGKAAQVNWYVDISALKRAQDSLNKAKEEAEAATRAKSTFLATMSHEIRTPINGVMSMAELLDRTPLDEEQRSMSNVIRESAHSLLSIIGDILDFSKIEAGRLDLEETLFNLRELVEGVADLLAVKAAEKGLEIFVSMDPDAQDTFHGDPARLRQVLLNLTGNAVKFTEVGYISINVQIHTEPADTLLPNLSVSESGQRQRIVIEIRDTGIGMTMEQQNRLFQPFAQADPSTARQYGGTGLGLSICKRLIDLMEGSISVESTAGVGSTFRVQVAFHAADEIEAEKRACQAGTCVPGICRTGEWSDFEDRSCALLASSDSADPDPSAPAVPSTPSSPSSPSAPPVPSVPSIASDCAAPGATGSADKDGEIDGLPDLSGIRVLIYSALPPLARVMTRYLVSRQAVVETVTMVEDIDRSLDAAAEQKPFDVVILDQPTGGRHLSPPRGDTITLLMIPPTGTNTEHTGFDHVVTKPVHRNSLVYAVALAGKRLHEDDLPDRKGLFLKQDFQPPSVDQAEEAGVLILVAEDHPTNRLVISKLLQHLGFAAEFAVNGAEALTMMGKRRYGLVLTDCHMPVMDGYRLTELIRARETALQEDAGYLAERTRLPILALTADALPGTAQTCRDAGMDDYLSKPVALDRLEKAISHWLPTALEWRRLQTGAAAEEVETRTIKPVSGSLSTSPVEQIGEDDRSKKGGEAMTGNGEDRNGADNSEETDLFVMDEDDVLVDYPDPSDGPVVLDLEPAKMFFGDSPEQAKEMLQFFLDSTRGLIDDIETGYTAGDMTAVREAAHGTKGAANTAGANKLGQLCADLQHAVDGGDMERVMELVPVIRPAFDEVAAAVDAL